MLVREVMRSPVVTIHPEAILRQAGYTAEQIQELRDTGIVD